MNLPEKMDLSSLDVAGQKRDQLKQALGAAFPEVFSEGSIDFDALLRLLGEATPSSKERYGLNWAGKADCMKVIQQTSIATLSPKIDDSVNFEDSGNVFIEGDNLEVLKLLQKSYFGKIDLIYIDPPYNTGNDFVYNDDFKDSLPAYLSLSSQTDDAGRLLSTNTDSSGRYHSNWLSMLYPRLYLASNLLNESGLIFISIDENEISNLRLICDDIFGSENFLGQVTILCNPKGRSQDKYLANCHEYLVIYSKNPLPAGAISVPKDKDEIEADYSLSDNDGPYRELELRNTHREFGQHNRPNLYYPFYVANDGKVSLDASSGAVEVYPDWDDGFKGCWTWGRDKATKDIALVSARLVGGRFKIYRKSYAYSEGDVAKKQLKSIWTDKKYHTEKGQASFNALFDEKEKIFQSPKSVELVAETLRMLGKSDALILDFFAGSGTTAHAVYEQNAQDGGRRNFILVQLPEKTPEDSVARARGYEDISAISKERIRRASKKIAEGLLSSTTSARNVGFRAFSLEKSNFKIWKAEADEFDVGGKQLEFHVENIEQKSTDFNILFELLLKAGFPLTTRVSELVMDGKTVYSVEDGALLICLEKEITPALIDALAEADPLQVICLDEGFKGNDQLKANAVQTFKARAQAEESEIVFRTV